MKKIYFFILGIFFILTTSFAFDKIIFDNTYSLNKLNNIYLGSPQIIMLGSSRCLGSFIPSIIDSTNSSYNFGLSGTGNKLWLNIIKDLIQDDFSQLIIINIDNVNLEMESSSNSDGDFRNYIKTKRNKQVFKNLNKETKEKIKKFPFYYFGDLLNFTRSYIREKINFTGFFDKGCRIELNNISDKEFYKRIKIEKSNFRISEKTKVFFDNFDKISNQMDTIIFVNLPVFSLGKNNNAAFIFLENNYPNIGSYINLEDVIKDREYFFDPNHPSLLGAKKISEALKDSISSSYLQNDF